MPDTNEARRLGERIERFARQMRLAAGLSSGGEFRCLLRDLEALVALAEQAPGGEPDELLLAVSELSMAMGSPAVMAHRPQSIASQTVRLAAERIRELNDPARAGAALMRAAGGMSAAGDLIADALQYRAKVEPAEGWVLVPKEPTLEMLEAYWEKVESDPSSLARDLGRNRYQAMLAAAPKQGV